jgi:hypothetical protein
LAEYEIVILQPDHFLPDDSSLLFYNRQNGRVESSTQVKIVDRVLRGSDISPNLHPFRFIGNRTLVNDTINPYLVILAAEIKFRRYLAANGPPLPPVYDSLMQKTIEVAKLLYFRPVWGESSIFFQPIPVRWEGHHPPPGYTRPEVGFQTGGDGSGVSIAHQQRQPADSDGGGSGIRRARAGKKKKIDSETIDYWRDMLSGRGMFQFLLHAPSLIGNMINHW